MIKLIPWLPMMAICLVLLIVLVLALLTALTVWPHLLDFLSTNTDVQRFRKNGRIDADNVTLSKHGASH